MTTKHPAVEAPLDVGVRPLCSHCGFPLLTNYIGLRHFGTHTAHQEYECLRLLQAEIELLRAALTWALGANGDFRQQGTMDGAYWWRGELAERAGLRWDGAQYVSSSGPDASPQVAQTPEPPR